MLLFVFMVSCSRLGALSGYKDVERYGVFNTSTTLAERVAQPPAFLLEALKKMDNRNDYLAYVPTASEMRQIVDALDNIPDRQKAAMLSRLVGIFFVSNLSSGGYSDYLFDRNGTLHTILVLNPAILHTGISQWIKDKEMSAFFDDKSGVVMSVDCDEGERSALLYILLHESAHQLDYIAGCTPYVEKDLSKSGKPLNGVPFAAVTWKGYDLPLPAFDYSRRSQLRFYGNDDSAKLPGREMPAAYRRLAKTPFTLLYASQNWAEDFAETVAFTELKRIIGKGCRIHIKGAGKQDFMFDLLERKVAAERLPFLYSSCSAMP